MSNEQQQSQRRRNRNKSNTQGGPSDTDNTPGRSEADSTVKPETDVVTPEEIPIEDAMKAVTLAPHQVHNIFHFLSPLIIFVNV